MNKLSKAKLFFISKLKLNQFFLNHISDLKRFCVYGNSLKDITHDFVAPSNDKHGAKEKAPISLSALYKLNTKFQSHAKYESYVDDGLVVLNPSLYSKFKQSRVAYTIAAMLSTTALIAGCSSADEELIKQQENKVKDPINFKVEGISGDVEKNVKAYLDSLAVISKSRAIYYVREIRESVTKALRAYGYYHPKIHISLPKAENTQDFTTVINIELGKPLYIRNCNVQVLGEGANYRVFYDIVEESGLSSYQIINHGKYEELKTKLHETSISLGFFDGKFISSRILVYQDQNMADIELIYDTGRRYKFGQILASNETLDLLKPSVNLKKFKEGDLFSSKKVNEYVQSLTQTNYYNTVDVRPDVSKAENYEVPLEVNLERRSHNLMKVGIGYSTDEGPRALFEWDKPLLNDRGDSMSFLSTITKETQDVQFIYKIPRKNPNLDFYTINALQSHTELNDTRSDRSHLSFHYIANETGVWRRDYSIRAEYEDYTQASEYGYALNVMPGIRLTRRESTGGFDPKQGYSMSAEALGASSLWGRDTFLQIKVNYKGVIALTENSRFLFKLEQGVNIGPNVDELPPSLRFFAGGDNSIRGFGYRNQAPYQADGSGLKGGRYLTLGTAEVQVPVGIENARLALFLDAGLATDNYGSNLKEQMLWGPGLGVRYNTPYGALRADFAVGLQRNQDNNYRIHVAFGPEF